MKARKLGLLVLMTTGVIGTAQAQPDPHNPPKGTNPTAPVPLPRPRPPLMTSQMMRETQLRAQMAVAGFDQATQDAVVAFVTEREKARQALREQARKLDEALRGAAQGAMTDAQLLTLFGEFRAAVDEEKTRHKEALTALDAKIGYSKKPRLQVLLTLLGIIGDEASYLDDLGSGYARDAPFPWGGGKSRVFVFPRDMQPAPVIPPGLMIPREPFIPPDDMVRTLPPIMGDGFVFPPPPPWSPPMGQPFAQPYIYRIPKQVEPAVPPPPNPAPPVAPQGPQE